MDEFLFLFNDQGDQSGKKDNNSSINRKCIIQLEPAPLNSFQLVETINGLCELHCRLEGLLLSSAKNGPSVPELLPTLAAFEAATKALPAELPDLVAHWAAKRTEALAKYSELVKKLVAASQLGDPGLFGVMQPEKLKIPEKMEPFMVFPEEEEEEKTKKKCSKEPKPLYAYCDQLEELFSCNTENSALFSNTEN